MFLPCGAAQKKQKTRVIIAVGFLQPGLKRLPAGRFVPGPFRYDERLDRPKCFRTSFRFHCVHGANLPFCRSGQ